MKARTARWGTPSRNHSREIVPPVKSKDLAPHKGASSPVVREELRAEYIGPLPLPAHFVEYERTLTGRPRRSLRTGRTARRETFVGR
jgi:hypothetical protein